MALVKAVIEVLDRAAIDPSKGLLPFIPVQFNPTEYTLEKGAQLAEITIPGIDSPILQFIRGQNERLTLDLFYDTTTALGMGEAALDVRLLTTPIYQLAKIQPATHAPPRIRFFWGSLAFKAIVENVRQQFTLFNPLGAPAASDAQRHLPRVQDARGAARGPQADVRRPYEAPRRAARRHAVEHRGARVRRPARMAPDRRRERRPAG